LLSGGQRKRLCIATELLSSPQILFLDEPTSPLDPETIEDFLQCLKNLTLNGTTILMVTHKPDDLMFASHVIWMANGGYLVYADEVKNYLDYFSVNRSTELYALLKTEEKGAYWNQKLSIPISKEDKEIALSKDLIAKKPNYLSQYWILCLRFFKIKWNDKRNLLIQIFQAPLIGILLSIIFYNGLTVGLLFMLTISSIWFGIANSSKEIVDEESIFKRERQFNLRIAPYILSKLSILSIIGSIQILFLLFSINLIFYYNNLPNIDDLQFPFISLLLVNFASILMGFLLSALVSTSEKAMVIQPLMLIPQILLAGVIYPLKAGSSMVAFLSLFTLSRWGTLASTYNQKVIDFSKNNELILAEESLNMPDNFNIWQNWGLYIFNNQIMYAWTVILFICLILYGLVYWVMKKKDAIN
jgi:energy-coupling factor transporter ATP-binding protein EcfA2